MDQAKNAGSTLMSHDGTRKHLARLSHGQLVQVEAQLAAHMHDTYEITIPLKDPLHGFVVREGVLRPERMVALEFARFLERTSLIGRMKTVCDMGCGSGLQGIVAARRGVEEVVFLDISEAAVENTRENVARFVSGVRTRVATGDLFSGCDSRDLFDVVLFNHPFFADDPIEGLPVSKAMLDDGRLLWRFFQEVRQFTWRKSRILMPYFELAGETNHPRQGEKAGFIVSCVHKGEVGEGLQRGPFSIYQLKPHC